jgi:hypothetical protein
MPFLTVGLFLGFLISLVIWFLFNMRKNIWIYLN